MKVLLIDDNPDSLDSSARVIEHLGHTVHTLLESVHAAQKIEAFGPDVVVSDIMMPGASGLEVLRLVMERNNPPPVVLVTSFSQIDNAIQAVRLGAFDYLARPATVDSWAACLSRVEQFVEMRTALDHEKALRLQIAALLETQQEKDKLLRNKCKELETLNVRLQDNQKQMVQSEKLAAIGQLSAGVAHEINNPVGFVKSNLGTMCEYVGTLKTLINSYNELLEASQDLEATSKISGKIKAMCQDEDVDFIMEDIETLVNESVDGASRIQAIVQNLKSFARADSDTPEEADLNAGLEATLNIVWNEIKYHCDVHKDYGSIPMLRCHAGQLNQVFMNLLVNASHAIEDRGNIYIRTEEREGSIIVSIRDTGKGIAPENLSKIFDPFFTTKGIGKGTGLGLAISHGIVERHGGILEVDSKVGNGTEFRVILPLVKQVCAAGA